MEKLPLICRDGHSATLDFIGSGDFGGSEHMPGAVPPFLSLVGANLVGFGASKGKKGQTPVILWLAVTIPTLPSAGQDQAPREGYRCHCYTGSGHW